MFICNDPVLRLPTPVRAEAGIRSRRGERLTARRACALLCARRARLALAPHVSQYRKWVCPQLSQIIAALVSLGTSAPIFAQNARAILLST
jgi:hypothetical protein